MNLAMELLLTMLVILAIVAAIIDIYCLLIPDSLNVVLFLGGLTNAFWVTHDLVSAIIGAIVGGSIFLIVRSIHLSVRDIEGLGWGDIKFAIAAGAWTGWLDLPAFIAIASLAGLVYVGVCATLGRRVNVETRIPFCPFLSFGLVVVILVHSMTGSNLLDLWMG